MKGPGLLQMIEIIAGLSIAGPMFLVAVEFLRTGQFAFGIGMLALALVAMFFPSYLLRRMGAWFKRPFAGGDDAEHTSLLDRFRR